ncbi:MAG: cysteine hydrolase [Chloroflexi bacterium]|nr:cysteine hydrolase [Chloroflexota bacterium]
MDLEVKRSALLTLYCQNAWAAGVLREGSRVLDRIAAAQEAARRAGMEVIHVGVAFPPGFGVIGPLSNHHELTLRARGAGVLGTPGAEFHPRVAPRAGELALMSQCSGPLVGTPLEQALRGRDIRTLVVTGISTSGSVKNLVTDGTNRFFDVVVLGDCCEDRDPEVDEVLKDRVFPQVCQVCRVASFEEFLAALPPMA